jgi:predicted  nucleic acid-binding Zn-ribbon protein
VLSFWGFEFRVIFIWIFGVASFIGMFVLDERARSENARLRKISTSFAELTLKRKITQDSVVAELKADLLLQENRLLAAAANQEFEQECVEAKLRAKMGHQKNALALLRATSARQISEASKNEGAAATLKIEVARMRRRETALISEVDGLRTVEAHNRRLLGELSNAVASEAALNTEVVRLRKREATLDREMAVLREEETKHAMEILNLEAKHKNALARPLDTEVAKLRQREASHLSELAWLRAEERKVKREITGFKATEAALASELATLREHAASLQRDVTSGNERLTVCSLLQSMKEHHTAPR